MSRSLTGDLRGRFLWLARTYAAHLFDYAQDLLGDRAGSAEAVEGALTEAINYFGREELDEAGADGSLRAWLYAAVRRECLITPSVHSEEVALDRDGYPDQDSEQDVPRFVTGSSRAQEAVAEVLTAEYMVPELEAEERRRYLEAVTQVLGGLSDEEVEVLSLSVRHRLDEDDLAVVLDRSPRSAHAELSAATARFDQLATAILLLHAGWSGCKKLDRLVGGSYPSAPDDRMCRQVARHSKSCATCGQIVASRGFGPEFLNILPIAELPPAVRRWLGSVAPSRDVDPPEPPDRPEPDSQIPPGLPHADLPDLTSADESGVPQAAGPYAEAAADGQDELRYADQANSTASARSSHDDPQVPPVSRPQLPPNLPVWGRDLPDSGPVLPVLPVLPVSGPEAVNPETLGPEIDGLARWMAAKSVKPVASDSAVIAEASAPPAEFDPVRPSAPIESDPPDAPGSSDRDRDRDDVEPTAWREPWLTRPRAAVLSTLAVVIIASGAVLANKLSAAPSSGHGKSASVTTTQGPSSAPSGTAPSPSAQPLLRARPSKSGGASPPAGNLPVSPPPFKPTAEPSLLRPTQKPSSPKPKPSSPKPKPTKTTAPPSSAPPSSPPPSSPPPTSPAPGI